MLSAYCVAEFACRPPIKSPKGLIADQCTGSPPLKRALPACRSDRFGGRQRQDGSAWWVHFSVRRDGPKG